MDENILRNMIEGFFNAELTVEEEQELYRYLCENDVPASLYKDKEAIMALCSEEQPSMLPAGADLRLEAMLDALAENEEPGITDERSTTKARKPILRVSRIVWHGAAVAAVAVLAVGYLFVRNEEQLPVEHAGQVVMGSQVAAAEAELYEPEEDTFDNPEDAMRYFKAAMGDIRFAFNTTKKNTHEIGNTLIDAFLPYKEIININIQ